MQECNIEEGSDEEEPQSKSSKDKKANGPDSGKAPSLVFKITSKVPYKTVLKGMPFPLINVVSLMWTSPHSFLLFWVYKPIFNAISIYLAAHSAVVLKAESMTDKIEWMNKIRNIIQPSKGGQLKGASNEGGLRQSFSDGSLVSY